MNRFICQDLLDLGCWDLVRVGIPVPRDFESMKAWKVWANGIVDKKRQMNVILYLATTISRGMYYDDYGVLEKHLKFDNHSCFYPKLVNRMERILVAWNNHSKEVRELLLMKFNKYMENEPKYEPNYLFVLKERNKQFEEIEKDYQQYMENMQKISQPNRFSVSYIYKKVKDWF